METINLFEFGKWRQFANDEKVSAAFDNFLNTLWQNRKEASLGYHENDWDVDDDATEQQFLSVNFKKQIRAKNYVGVIRYKETVINILPKIFKQDDDLSDSDLQRIHAHILWWLSYNSKINFPKSWSNFNHIKSDFFEILIYLFASYTKTTLSKILYQNYQEVENELPYMKGRLNMTEYVQRNLSQGRWHLLSCVYSSFELDNRFNRIIKYVAKILIATTQDSTNKQLLSDINFLLNEVQDQRMVASDCDKVHINPLHQELKPILDYCRLFLSNSTVLQYKNEFEVFAFLIPMEIVFEDFVSGFLQRHFTSQFKAIKQQKSDKYLALSHLNENVFQLRHDIYIEKHDNSKIIIDTKYKRLKRDDKKNGIAQSDMYQMIAYAIRRNCKDIKLIYPSFSDTYKEDTIYYHVQDEIAGLQPENRIKIEVHEIPIAYTVIDFQVKPNSSLERQFADLTNDLVNTLSRMLMN